LNTFGCHLSIAFSDCLGPMLVMMQVEVSPSLIIIDVDLLTLLSQSVDELWHSSNVDRDFCLILLMTA